MRPLIIVSTKYSQFPKHTNNLILLRHHVLNFVVDFGKAIPSQVYHPVLPLKCKNNALLLLFP